MLLEATLAYALVGGIAPTPPPPPPVPFTDTTCFEDEAIVWTGDRHNACVPWDDMYFDAEGTVTWPYDSLRYIFPDSHRNGA